MALDNWNNTYWATDPQFYCCDLVMNDKLGYLVLRGDVWSFGIVMFEVLSIGEDPYHHFRINNDLLKKRMKKEYEWVIEYPSNVHEFIPSTYFDTGRKPWASDILRCRNPENLFEFGVNREHFDEVMKVYNNSNKIFKYMLQIIHKI